MEQKINSIPSAETNDDISVNVEVVDTVHHHSSNTVVSSSALSPQLCINCINFNTDSYEKHLKCKGCFFVGNQQSNFMKLAV